MKTHREMIDKWPSMEDLAFDLDLPSVNVRVMKHRNSIPSAHWYKFYMAAQSRGFDKITLEAIAKAARKKDRAHAST